MKAGRVDVAPGLWLRWTLLSALGLALGIPAGLAVGIPVEALLGMMVVAPAVTAVIGSMLGASQWILLRRQFEHAGGWVLCSAVGLTIGLTAGVVAVEVGGQALLGRPVSLATLDLWGRALGLAFAGGVGGAVLGAAQWLVLRRRVEGAGRWVAVSTAALALGFSGGSLLADSVFGGLLTPVGFVAFVLAGGLLAGGVTGRTLVRLTPL